MWISDWLFFKAKKKEILFLIEDWKDIFVPSPLKRASCKTLSGDSGTFFFLRKFLKATENCGFRWNFENKHCWSQSCGLSLKDEALSSINTNNVDSQKSNDLSRHLMCLDRNGNIWTPVCVFIGFDLDSCFVVFWLYQTTKKKKKDSRPSTKTLEKNPVPTGAGHMTSPPVVRFLSWKIWLV